MNLHALRLFMAVAEAGSVTRAAERLNISQPAVTAQVRNLEAELGLKLLAPKGRGILLTEAGEFTAEQARRLFAHEAEVENAIAEYRSGRSGSLRLAATYLPAHVLLPAWIAAFKKTYGDVVLTLHTSNADLALRQLSRYEVDLAIVGGSPDAEPGISRTLLFEDPMWFVVPSGHLLANQEVPLAEMLQEPFLMREEGSYTRRLLLSLCHMLSVPPPRPSVQMSGIGEAVRSVAAGYGATFASASEVKPYIARGEVARVHVPHTEAVNRIYLCRRSADPLTRQAEAFIRVMDEHPAPGSGV